MKKMIGIKVEPEIKKMLQKLADQESRNLSNFCYYAIKNYVKEHYQVDVELEDKKKANP
jgi:predicted transcriptional regulator